MIAILGALWTELSSSIIIHSLAMRGGLEMAENEIQDGGAKR